MEVVHPEFDPEPGIDREEMERLQRDVAASAHFSDDHDLDPDGIRIDDPIPLDQTDRPRTPGTGPIIAGVDQAFLDETAVSVVVAMQSSDVVAVTTARTPLEVPYIPGLLAFREGPPIVEALEGLSVDPDLVFFDGSGRIHFRQAGIATHVGVVFDVPAIGVAKNLLCGRQESDGSFPLPEGTRIPILSDSSVDAPESTVIGYAFQSRQFDNPSRRHVNPLYVSPGHRVSAGTAVDFTEAVCAGYKLPEPIRLADSLADDVVG
ncbi:MAG: endonuclease V [Halodesulfurarchaeum sp.]